MRARVLSETMGRWVSEQSVMAASVATRIVGLCERPLVAAALSQVQEFVAQRRATPSQPNPAHPQRTAPQAITRRVATNWHDGQNSDLPKPQIRCPLRPSRSDKRGGRASSRTRDGMWWTRQRRRAWRSQGEMNLVSNLQARRTNDALAYGKTVWS